MAASTDCYCVNEMESEAFSLASVEVETRRL